MPFISASRILQHGRRSLLMLAAAAVSASAAESKLREQLSQSPFQIVYESHVDQNWELFAMNADGSHRHNLTRTPNTSELYPQVSPDGSKIAFVVDEGEGRDTVRSVWVMEADGSDRRKVADYARQPFWHPNSSIIAYLPQEYPKFNVVDFFTKGIMFHDLATGKTTPHSNNAKIHHLYNPGFSPNGKWIVATVHAGMEHDHAILLIEANGDRILNLGIPGCRPVISPDGKFIAWGPGDHELATASLDTDADEPKVGPRLLQIFDEEKKVYHIDWSPDGKYVSLSRGPNGEGDLTKPNTHTGACEIVGVHARGWDLFAVPSDPGVVHLDQPEPAAVQLTTDGNSNKESAWFKPKK